MEARRQATMNASQIPSLSRSQLLAAAMATDSVTPPQFKDSTKFDVIIEGKRYPPKAVVGVAAMQAAGGELHQGVFPAGWEVSASQFSKPMALSSNA